MAENCRLTFTFPKKNWQKEKHCQWLWYHGSGWKGGSKSGGGIARGLVDYGYIVVGVEYRLSGKALSPAQVQDSKSAVRWIRANAEKYGFDPDRIAVMGRSWSERRRNGL